MWLHFNNTDEVALEHLRRLVALEPLSQLHTLILSEQQLGGGVLHLLFGPRALGKLKTLHVAVCGVKPGDMARALSMTSGPMAVEDLDISHTPLSLDDVAQMGCSSRLRKLRKLNMKGTQFTDRHADVLFRGTALSTLEELDCAAGPVGERTCRALSNV